MSLNQHQIAVQRKLQAACRVDEKIRRMIDRIAVIRNQSLAMKANISDMPGSPNRNIHMMEDSVIQAYEMEAVAEKELKHLFSIKAEVQSYIYQVEDLRGQIILEHRYLLDETWETIAEETGCSIRTVRRIHDIAIDQIVIQ